MSFNDHHSFKKAYTTTEKLRFTCVTTLIPALVLNITHAAIYYSPYPALGLIPAVVSTLFALYELGYFNLEAYSRDYQIRLQDESDPPRRSNIRMASIVLFDIVLATGLIGCIGYGLFFMTRNGNEYWKDQGIKTCHISPYINNRTGLPYVEEWNGRYEATDGSIVGAYATVPFFVNG